MSARPDPIGDLVVANHILYRQGVVDGFGHVSARHPENPNRYFIARSMAPALVTAEDILELDLDSNPLRPDAPTSYLERFIHGEIYRARPDVHAVMHTHPQWSTFLTMTGVPYKAVYAQGVLLAGIPLLDSPLSVNTKATGEKLAAKIGRAHV